MNRDPFRIRVYRRPWGAWETRCQAHAYRVNPKTWRLALGAAQAHSAALHWKPLESAWNTR